MKSETWNLFSFFDYIIRKDQFYIDSLLFEFEHDTNYKKDTGQLEIDHILDDDYDFTLPPSIVTFDEFITERLIYEINSFSSNIEKEYFSIDNESGKKAFIRPIISKVVYLKKKLKSYNGPYCDLFSEYLQNLHTYLEDRYEDEVKETLEPNADNTQGKNKKIHANLNRDQLGALLHLLQESDIIDGKVKPSLLARVIESNVLILDVSHNYGPVKQLDVLLSQLKNNEKDFVKILSEVILKFKTSSAFNS